jgi:hypothetical protein
MADRDILPSDFKPSHYDLTIKDLNFNDWSYKGLVASVLMAGNLTSPLLELSISVV